MTLYESIRICLRESAGATTITFVNTGKSTIKTKPAPRLVKTVWNNKVQETIDNLTDPYWGYRVESKHPATPAEIAKLSDEDSETYKQAGPRPGSDYRGD